MDTGKKIRILREEKGLKQEEIAKAVGYSNKNSISKIERGGAGCPEAQLIKIVEIFGMTLKEFYNYEPKEDIPEAENKKNIVEEPIKLYLPKKDKKNMVDYMLENRKLLEENDYLKTILLNKYQIDVTNNESE